WLQAELRRRLQLAGGLVLELEGGEWLLTPGRLERLLELATLGVGLCVHDRSGGLEEARTWSGLPLDPLSLPGTGGEAFGPQGQPEDLGRALSRWSEKGRRVIGDGVDGVSDIPAFTDLGIDYLRGQGLAAIGPRLDFDFG